MIQVLQSSPSHDAAALEHLLPDKANHGAVELSIVIPAMNEEITAGEFIDWCKEGLERAQVSGQILIVDSSTDNTPGIVLALLSRYQFVPPIVPCTGQRASSGANPACFSASRTLVSPIALALLRK